MLDRNLLERDDLGLLDELVAGVEDDVDGYVDIRRHEVLRVPVAAEEGDVAASEQQEGEGDQREPGGVRLERAFPRKALARDALGFAAVVEAQVDGADGHPPHQGRHGHEVLEPSEGDRCAGREGHESEADRGGEGADRDVRYPHPVGPEKDLRRVALASHPVQCSGAAEETAVAS